MNDARDRSRRPMVLVVLVALVCTVVALPPTSSAGPGGPRARKPKPVKPLADHVVLIGIDGFDPDYLGRVPTPNLDHLAARGASGRTRGVMLPITNPSFSSLVTGAWPERTGNVAYIWDQVANTYRGQSRSIALPTLAEHVRAAGGTTASAQYFILQNRGTSYGDAEALYTQPGGSCTRRFDDAIAMLRRQPVQSGGAAVTVPEVPTLTAVYCSDLDSIGHDEGADSPNLLPALAEVDAQVGRLLTTLDEEGLADRTTIVLTGDHGMSTYTQTFGLPLAQALQAAGYRPAFLWTGGQSVPPTANVVIVTAGRSLSVYLAGDTVGDPGALARVRAVAEGVPGTGRVLDRADQRALHMAPGYGDLVVESEPGWGAGILPVPGPRGDHGSSDEQDAVYVIAGAGVRRTRCAPTIRHVDVAPTITALLGLPPMSGAQGQVRTDLLRPIRRGHHGGGHSPRRGCGRG